MTIYLDHAGTAPLLPAAEMEIVNFYQRYATTNNPRNFVNIETEKINTIRSQIKKFLNATDNWDIVFSRSASEAISTIAYGLHWSSNNEILISDIEHSANVLPWLDICRKFGCNLRIIPSKKNGYINFEQILHYITKQTKLISVTLMSHVHGTVQDIQFLAQQTKNMPILLVVDAAQAIGRIPIDIEQIGCDFLVASGRKALMAPLGTGFLCGKHEKVEQLFPLFMSGRNATVNAQNDLKIAQLPVSLEPNLPSLGCLFGLGKAVQVAHEQQNQTRLRLIELTEIIVNGMKQISSIQFSAELEPKSSIGIVSFRSKKHTSSMIFEKMNNYGIIIGKCRLSLIHLPGDEFYLRISPSPETKLFEIEIFLETLAKIEEEER